MPHAAPPLALGNPLIKCIATVRIELASGRLKSIKGASSESGRAVSLDAPGRPVFQGPIKQGTFKTDVVASFLALDPFVTKDLLAFG